MIHVSQFSGHSFRIKATAVSNVGLSNSLIRPLADAAYASSSFPRYSPGPCLRSERSITTILFACFCLIACTILNISISFPLIGYVHSLDVR